MGKTIHLNLTKQWFDKHLEDKTEEYRAITPYWCSRFLLDAGEHQKRDYWKMIFYCEGDNAIDFILSCIEFGVYSFKPYDTAIYSNGMKPVAVLPRFKRPINTILIAEGREEWGAKKGVKYFVLKHGDVFDKVNINILENCNCKNKSIHTDSNGINYCTVCKNEVSLFSKP